ncbi:MAG: GumC family protein [Sedimentitalea sp.]
MGPIYSVDELLDMVRRRALFMFFVIVLGSLAGLYWAWSQQHMYRASEVIQIARPKIADDLAPSTVAGSSARRLQLIQQQLMTRGSVLEVIEAYGLYADTPDMKPSELVNRLRNSVRIEGVAAAREGFADDGTMSVLTITAEMPNAEQAMLVAQELAHRTINLSTNSRIEQAKETLEFFSAQEDALRAQVLELDNRLAEFRNANELSIPGGVEFRRSELASINQAVLDIDRQRIQLQRESDQISDTLRPATARRQRAEFAEQITTLDDQRRLLSDRRDELAKSIETSPDVERELGAFERQRLQLQEQLNVISTRRNEAEVGFRLETRRQAERLTVIEPASLPDYPYTGSRKKKALMGAVGSVMAAFVLAYLLELRRPVIRTAAQMKRQVGIAPVVTIPYLDVTPKPRPWWRRIFGRRRSDRGQAA